MTARTSTRRSHAGTAASRRLAFEPLEPRCCLSAPELLDTNPFGVSSSAQSLGSYATWAPPMAQAGAKWVRMFPTWSQIQPSRGTWNWSAVDSMLAAAGNNSMYVSGLFMYNAPWLAGSYPAGSDLTDFATYVAGVADHCESSVAYWEVWNEPISFGHVPAADYANMVVTAYDAAKAADPSCQIAMSVSSLDIFYLEQAIRAGAADHFDYIAVHPYEVLGTVSLGQEADYMSIVPTLRKMLAAVNPGKADVPIWFTEIGEAVSGGVTAAGQAQDLVKAYTMAIAQGAARVNWFEAKEGGYNMGLLSSSYRPNPAYTALQNLTARLGPNP